MSPARVVRRGGATYGRCMKMDVEHLLPARWPHLLAVVMLAACATTTHVASDYDRKAQFSNLHRFTLIVRPHTGASSGMLQQRVDDAIREDLTAKGFSYVASQDQADFAVDSSVGARDRLQASSSLTDFSSPWGPGGWGYELDVPRYLEANIAIEVIDVRSQKVVWHGAANGELSRSELENSEDQIREVVSYVLVGFPPT